MEETLESGIGIGHEFILDAHRGERRIPGGLHNGMVRQRPAAGDGATDGHGPRRDTRAVICSAG